MQPTDKPTTTASAPETRTLRERIVERSAEITAKHGHSLDIRGQQWRTIPAEKPTAQDDDGKISRSDWRALAITRYADVERYRTHAAQLAEALRDLVNVAQRIGPPAITRGGLCEEQDWQTAMRNAVAAITESGVR